MTRKHIKTDQITHKEPGNGLPKWVKQAAVQRGYTDAPAMLSLIVTEHDINEAFDCAAHGDGAHCVMAQAGQRLGAKYVYFYRTTAWVDFGTGPILRYVSSQNIRNNIIKPFDKGDREAVIPGHYPLKPPSSSQSLKAGRKKNKNRKKSPESPPSGIKRDVVAHTDRVVMAAQTDE